MRNGLDRGVDQSLISWVKSPASESFFGKVITNRVKHQTRKG